MADNLTLNLKILRNKTVSTSIGFTLTEVLRSLEAGELKNPYREMVSAYQNILMEHHDLELKSQVKKALDRTINDTTYDESLVSDCPTRTILFNHYMKYVKSGYNEHSAALMLKILLLSLPVDQPPEVTHFELASHLIGTLYFLTTSCSHEVYLIMEQVICELKELVGEDISWRFEN